MPLEEYVGRNLNKTATYLLETPQFKNKVIELKLTAQEQLAISFMNLDLPERAYTTLHCKASLLQIYSVVLCRCCSSRTIFLRNSSLLSIGKIKNPKIFKDSECKNDPFLNYIEALTTFNLELLIDVINQLPDFFESYQALCNLSDKSYELFTPLSIYYYLKLKICKDIDIPLRISEIINHVIFNEPTSIDCTYYLPVIKSHLDLVAAYFYCTKETEKSKTVYKMILNKAKMLSGIRDICDGEYLYFYALILYASLDPQLNDFAYFFPPKQLESLVWNGISEVSLGHYEEAKDLFLEALEIKNGQYAKSDLLCLIGHCCVKLNDKKSAMSYIQDSLVESPNNFRFLYIAAQEYFEMKKLDACLEYCKRALTKRDSGSITKLIGRVYSEYEKFDIAKSYFIKAAEMNEVDSLLYLADDCKKQSNISEAIELYEKYSKVGDINKTAVIQYLVNYFDEQGDMEKFHYYKNQLTRLKDE